MSDLEFSTAEIAVSQIGEIIDSYTDGDVRPIATLSRIARVLGQYEAAK